MSNFNIYINYIFNFNKYHLCIENMTFKIFLNRCVNNNNNNLKYLYEYKYMNIYFNKMYE